MKLTKYVHTVIVQRGNCDSEVCIGMAHILSVPYIKMVLSMKSELLRRIN